MLKGFKIALGFAFATGLIGITSTVQASKADSYAIYGISSHLKKDSDIFSGANISKDGVLTFVIKDSAAYDDVAGFKATQKVFLRDIKTAIGKYGNNPLANNGILVTGARIKLDDGTKKPLFVLYDDKSTIDTVDYSNAINNYNNPTALLSDSTSYFIYKSFLKYNDATGIFKKVAAYDTDCAPDWFRPFVQGTTTVRAISSPFDTK